MNAPLMEFVEYDGTYSGQLGIPQDLPGENPFGYDFDPAVLRNPAVRAGQVADCPAYWLAKDVGDSVGGGPRGEATDAPDGPDNAITVTEGTPSTRSTGRPRSSLISITLRMACFCSRKKRKADVHQPSLPCMALQTRHASQSQTVQPLPGSFQASLNPGSIFPIAGLAPGQLLSLKPRNFFPGLTRLRSRSGSASNSLYG